MWRACALTLGVLISYLGYAITHHAIHHWRIDNAWLKRRQRWHARHHHTTQTTGYGVTSAFWDQVSGTAHPASPPPPLITTQHAVEHGAI
jgi:cyclopropane-fatty-acyl-phospholipid synthase